MGLKGTSALFRFGFLFWSLLAPFQSSAQSAGAFSGVVIDSAGKPVANAGISARSVADGHSDDVQTDASGRYTVSGLAAGEYVVSAFANGLRIQSPRLTLAGCVFCAFSRP